MSNIKDVLDTTSLNQELRNLVEAAVERSECLGAILYGSVARGDQTNNSDIDLLRLVRHPGRQRLSLGRLSVADYPPGTLRRMAQGGSLFILHLRLEGKILYDPSSALAEILNSYVQPASYTLLQTELRRALSIFDLTEEEAARYQPGLIRVAKFLLRTELFRRCAEKGIPVFSRREIERVLGVSWVDELLSSRRRVSLAELRERLEVELGEKAHNPTGSLEALAITIKGVSPFVAHLIATILGGGDDLNYATGATLVPLRGIS